MAASLLASSEATTALDEVITFGFQSVSFGFGSVGNRMICYQTATDSDTGLV